MKKLVCLLVALWGCFTLIGCAAQNESFVKEAEAVKTDALEPVIFRSDKLVTSLRKIKPSLVYEQSDINELMTQIKSEIEKTKRFKYVMVLKKGDVTDEREGFLIYPEPQREGGQYRVAGRICKSIGGELKSHHFIRSDLCGSPEQANELMVDKAKNFIRHVQDEMFNPPRP